MTQKIDRRRFVGGLGGISLVALAGCLEDDDDDTDDTDDTDNGEELEEDEFEDAEPDEDGEVLVWDAGGTGGTYFPLSGEFKSLVDGNTPHALQVQSTGASVENVGALNREDSDFALIQNDIAIFAYEGTDEIDALADQDPVENLRGVATLYPETIHLVTPADSGIESVTDLEGATVNTGDLGSGTQVNALQILESAGLADGDFNEENSDFDTAADQIRDGDIDAAFVVGGAPVGAIEELATTEDISLVEIAGDLQDDVKADAEWMAADTVEGGTYDGVDDDVETVSVQAMIATHENVDDGIVEDVTAAIFDNVDELTIETENINVESAQDGMPIPLHPGAEAYFG